MKKYERIIKNLVELDNASFKVYELKLTTTPGSDEWKELEAKENEYDELIKQEFDSFSKCIEWYAKRAKTNEAIELVEELRETYKELHDHLVCDLSDGEINEMATAAAEEILGDIMEDNVPTEEMKKCEKIISNLEEIEEACCEVRDVDDSYADSAEGWRAITNAVNELTELARHELVALKSCCAKCNRCNQGYKNTEDAYSHWRDYMSSEMIFDFPDEADYENKSINFKYPNGWRLEDFHKRHF